MPSSLPHDFPLENLPPSFRPLAHGYAVRAAAIVDVIRLIAAPFRTLAAAFSEGRRMRNVYGDLSRMSARELADLGLERGDIASVAAGTFKPAPRTVSVTPVAAPQAPLRVVKPAAAERKAA